MSHASNSCRSSGQRQQALARASGSAIPYPSTMRRVWVAGIQYGNETMEQMLAREARCREEDARADAEEKRLYAWKCRPWWEDAPVPNKPSDERR